MNMFISSLVVPMVVTVSIMFVIRPMAIGFGLVDHPGGRKFHDGVIPVIGGIAMLVGVLSGLLLLDLAPSILLSVISGSCLLVAAGALDDRFAVPPLARIPAQVVAVLILVYGAHLSMADMGDPFGIGVIYTGRFELLFTLLVTIATINAYNYVDGVDGLAGSLALMALLPIALVAGIANPFSAVALTVSAAVFGFLLFNFPVIWNRRLRSFMGDAGSTLLGFSIVWIMMGVCQGPDRVISPVNCLWFAALPIFDFFNCFVRRILNGKSPWTPGRDHLHHILHRGGFGVRQTLAILTGTQAGYSLIGIAGFYAGVPDVALFAAWSILGLSQASVIRLVAKHNRRRSIHQK